MFPFLDIGGAQVSTYRVCMGLAFAVAGGLCIYANRKSAEPLRMGFIALLTVYLASLLGAKIMFLLLPGDAAVGSKVLGIVERGTGTTVDSPAG